LNAEEDKNENFQTSAIKYNDLSSFSNY
jgi:hypothetical protein